jgi:hypothetical protein
MKKVERFKCWICNKEYGDIADAKGCEANGIMTPYFKIGDMVKYQTNVGSDRDGSYYADRSGKIIDILFPVPPEYLSIGHVLMHEYDVSYLVRRVIEKHESESSNQFFDQEKIELLQAVKSIEVVDENSMFFEDGIKIDDGNRLRRTVVTSWPHYVAEVVRRNPQLKNRLRAFTVKLKKLRCIE